MAAPISFRDRFTPCFETGGAKPISESYSRQESWGRFVKDLIVLTACKNASFAVKGVLTRVESLGIRQITCDLDIHPERDPGCLKGGIDFLRSQARRYEHSILMFDFEGSGLNKQDDPVLVATSLRERLSNSGWGDRAEVIITNPELEIWVWSDSPEVDRVLGWGGRIPGLRQWLTTRGLLNASSQIKPERPKEAVDAALYEVNLPRSSSLYFELASKISLQRCTDPNFLALKNALLRWFPAP